MPANLSDEDLTFDSFHLIEGKIGLTTTSMSLIAFREQVTAQKMNFGTVTDGDGTRCLNFEEKQDLVRYFSQYVEMTFLSDEAGPETQRMRIFGNY